VIDSLRFVHPVSVSIDTQHFQKKSKTMSLIRNQNRVNGVRYIKYYHESMWCCSQCDERVRNRTHEMGEHADRCVAPKGSETVHVSGREISDDLIEESNRMNTEFKAVADDSEHN
jgi:hypothetical protein